VTDCGVLTFRVLNSGASTLILCDAIVFDVVDLIFGEFFEWSQRCGTRGCKYNQYKNQQVRVLDQNYFFSERVITVWNGLAEDFTDFRSLALFKNSILATDFTAHLKCI